MKPDEYGNLPDHPDPETAKVQRLISALMYTGMGKPSAAVIATEFSVLRERIAALEAKLKETP